MPVNFCADDFRHETERLALRAWSETDLADLVALNSDPRVMEHFPATLSPDESRILLGRLRHRIAEDGFSFMPVEERESGRFVGFVGLNRPLFPAPVRFEPCVEIGWRLMPWAWGRGYASEAARQWFRFGFETLGLDEIVAFTAVANVRSQAVMRRLGMRADGGFDHPAVPDTCPDLRPHVLYRLSREEFDRA